MLPRLVSISWGQVVLLPWPPKVLELQLSAIVLMLACISFAISARKNFQMSLIRIPQCSVEKDHQGFHAFIPSGEDYTEVKVVDLRINAQFIILGMFSISLKYG